MVGVPGPDGVVKPVGPLSMGPWSQCRKIFLSPSPTDNPAKQARAFVTGRLLRLVDVARVGYSLVLHSCRIHKHRGCIFSSV